MKLLKQLIFLFFGLISAVTVLNAQTVTQPDLNRSLIPPSPDAASLGKFGILPVTLYEGMPNRTVPIYEMKVGKLSLPINLSYNYNGYRPGEEASWVGLGWTLQAQGVITRQVKGLVDDVFIPNQLHQWADYANILDQTENPEFMQLVADRQIDAEPDIYVFSFPGHSGKFLITGSRIFVFPHQDLVVTRVGTGFRIIDENGTAYNFYPAGAETTMPNNNTTPGNFTPHYLSAWNLTSIVSVDNTDEIDFQYTPFIHHQASNSYSETYSQKYGDKPPAGAMPPGMCTGLNADCDDWSQTIYPGGNIDARRLTGITCNNTRVSFIPETTPRQDLNSVQAFALKEIDIYSFPDSSLVKRIKLNHGYFTDAPGVATQLKLSSVDLIGHSLNSTDSIVLPAYYSFEYANETSAFPKITRGIDKYGYYNGKDGNQMLFEQGFIGYTPRMPGANRDVDSTASINGIMTKMTYPTCGYTTFEYEKNKVYFPGTSTTQNMHTGLFVVNHGGNPETGSKSFTINVEQDIHIDYSRDISNNSNNWVHNIVPIINIYIPGIPDNVPPIPATLIYSSPLLSPGSSNNAPPPDVLHLMPGTYYYVVSCESGTLSAEGDINYIKQLNYTPPTDGPGLRIRTIASYDAINSATPALTKKYSYPSLGKILAFDNYGVSTVNHFCSGINTCYGWEYWENVFTSNGSSPLASLISNQFYYDSVIEINNDTQGAGKTLYEYAGTQSAMDINLIRQTEYSFLAGDYKMIHKKTNTYAGVSGINFWGFACNLSRIHEGCTIPLIPPYTYIFDTLTRYKKYQANAYAFGTEYMRLEATEEISTDQDGNNPMTVHSDYYYDIPDYMQPGRIVVNNSKGEIITTKTTYPLDYANPCPYPNNQEAVFNSTRAAVSAGYQNCVSARYNAAMQYWNGGNPVQNAQNSALLNVLRQYKCEALYTGQYATALANINTNCPPESSNSPAESVLGAMRAMHIITAPVEQITSLSKNGTPYLISANKTDYAQYGASITPKLIYQTRIEPSNTLLSDFTNNPGYYYQPRINFTGDQHGNIIEQSKQSDVKMGYVWDYNNEHLVAQCANAGTDDIAYTSFEAEGKGNFNFTGTITNLPGSTFTGNRYYVLNNGSITKPGLNTATVYTVSYWNKEAGGSFGVTGTIGTPIIGKTLNGWTYYEHTVSNISAITISGNGLIDELRLYPKAALMQTYTYDPVLGITAQCDGNNHLTTFEYDALSRLKIVRDEYRNILKQYDYKYCFDPLTASNINPIWQNTINTRCKPCPINNNYITNILQQEQRDINPQSSTYDQTRYTDIGPSVACDVNAYWENTATPLRCRVNEQNEYTGEQEQEQVDMNPCNATYLQTRWVIVAGFGASSACPLPTTCANCSAQGQKCIDGNCEMGNKIYSSSSYNKQTGLWTCIYHYEWSDRSISGDYTETSSTNCMIED